MEVVVMAISRNEPWTVVSQLQNEINRVFGNLNDGESSSATADWMPAVDVKEYADRFELLVDVPGVDPKQVEITLDNGVLTATGRDGVLAISIAKHPKAQPRRISVS
jgi:HSP20 family protein